MVTMSTSDSVASSDIVRPGSERSQVTPAELVGLSENSERAEQWRDQMDRITEAERTADATAATIRIR